MIMVTIGSGGGGGADSDDDDGGDDSGGDDFNCDRKTINTCHKDFTV
jgi:hypothetical protein